MKRFKLNLFFLFGISFALLQCRQNLPTEPGILSVRIPREPDQLNPVLSSTSIAATVQNLLFLPLMDFDPYTQNYKNILTEKSSEIIQRGNNIGYKIKIRSSAQWDDGTPVTASDVNFTLKSILNPYVKAEGKRGVISPIDSIEMTVDPKELIFWTDDNYFLDEQSFTNIFILQEARYDSTHILEPVSWSGLKYLKLEDTISETAKRALRFASIFANPFFGREGAQGNGPYFIDQWVTNQYIKLKRKSNWWGASLKDSAVNFASYPDEIVYRIIPEEANAVTALKDGLLDVISTDISPSTFKSLVEDSILRSRIEFMAGPSFRYLYLSLNNKSPLLSDKKTRRAIAQCINLDQLKTNLFKDYADRIVAPFQPSKSYYDHELSLIPFDKELAKKLLDESGWKDRDGNGIRDLIIAGKKRELKLRMLVTPGGLAQLIAIHLQEQAKSVGISIEIIPKPIHLILEQLNAHDFELAALADSQYPGPDDPYAFWHSESYANDGQNYTGFGSPATDSIIDQIRHSEAGPLRINLYKQLQKAIYDEQPAIFLFAPQNLMAVHKRWLAKSATVRPGYFVNDFRLK